MAGAVTAVDGIMAHCASCQEQESRMRNYLVQKSRSAVETSGAVFGNEIQNEVVILFCVASWFIRHWDGETQCHSDFIVNLYGDS